MEVKNVMAIMEECSKNIGKNNLDENMIVANDMGIYYDHYKLLDESLELSLNGRIVAFLMYDKINTLWCYETQVTFDRRSMR